ncbi:unnamed protein product [Amoebophrya sp. A120]|nr:unnamed protein product [Amoebophrya sp. A120]|eukprot:GSA120T00004513001.1
MIMMVEMRFLCSSSIPQVVDLLLENRRNYLYFSSRRGQHCEETSQPAMEETETTTTCHAPSGGRAASATELLAFDYAELLFRHPGKVARLSGDLVRAARLTKNMGVDASNTNGSVLQKPNENLSRMVSTSAAPVDMKSFVDVNLATGEVEELEPADQDVYRSGEESENESVMQNGNGRNGHLHLSTCANGTSSNGKSATSASATYDQRDLQDGKIISDPTADEQNRFLATVLRKSTRELLRRNPKRPNMIKNTLTSNCEQTPAEVPPTAHHDKKKILPTLSSSSSHAGAKRGSSSSPTTTSSSFIPLPFEPFPVPGGRFREVYYWDSYWNCLAFVQQQVEQQQKQEAQEHQQRRAAHSEDRDPLSLIENVLKNFLYLLNTFGFIPNGNRVYYLTRSQPPMFTEIVLLWLKEVMLQNECCAEDEHAGGRPQADRTRSGTDSTTAMSCAADDNRVSEKPQSSHDNYAEDDNADNHSRGGNRDQAPAREVKNKNKDSGRLEDELASEDTSSQKTSSRDRKNPRRSSFFETHDFLPTFEMWPASREAVTDSLADKIKKDEEHEDDSRSNIIKNSAHLSFFEELVAGVEKEYTWWMT